MEKPEYTEVEIGICVATMTAMIAYGPYMAGCGVPMIIA